MNMLEFGNQQKTIFSIAILNSSRFRESRSQTRKGKILYNKELRRAKRNIRKYKIKLNKPLPERFKL